ncbi:MAG: hypothetical protein ABFS16_16200 [Bacteroidota bacterium]
MSIQYCLRKIAIIVFITFLILCQSVYAQEENQPKGKTYLTAGFGVMEVFNIGLDLENNNSQFGFKVGGLVADGETLFSLTGDYSYYFAGNSKRTNNRTWFGKTGLQYFSDKADTFHEKAAYLFARVGKRFYFSSKAGVKIDLGMGFRIHHYEYYKQRPLIDFDFPVMPGMGISFFYRI